MTSAHATKWLIRWLIRLTRHSNPVKPAIPLKVLWTALAVALLATVAAVTPSAAAQDAEDLYYGCPDGFELNAATATCEAPPNKVHAYSAPTCTSGGALTPDRTACFYTVVPDLATQVVACPIGFTPSISGEECIRPALYEVTLDAPRCDAADGQDGQPTADARWCTLRTAPSSEMRLQTFVLPALITQPEPGQTVEPLIACPTGYDRVGEECVGEINLAPVTTAALEVGQPVTLGCAEGELLNATCVLSVANVGALAVYVAATDDAIATCNGIPVYYTDPAQCRARDNILVHSPSVAIQLPSRFACPGDAVLARDGATCNAVQGTTMVSVPPSEVTPDGIASCPSAFAGPTTQLQCTEQSEVPDVGDRCLHGTLWPGETGFNVASGPDVEVIPTEILGTCVLGHAPTIDVLSQSLKCVASELAADGLNCMADSIGLGCRPGQVASGGECSLAPGAENCPAGSLQDISPAGETGTRVICVISTSVGNGAWVEAFTTETCVIGEIDVVTGLCVTEVVTYSQPPDCFGYEITVDIGAGELPTEGDDVILGTSGPDLIAAGDGNDLICGLGGDDRIWGQGGDDVIVSLSGDNFLRGGDGDDALISGDGVDNLNGGRGDDYVNAGSGDDVAVRGGTGNDMVLAGDGDDELVAGNGGVDVVVGGAGDDKITGGPRGDSLWSGGGDDLMKGNGGNDRLWAVQDGAGTVELLGGPGRDVLVGGGDTLCNGGSTTVAEGAAPAEFDWAIDCSTLVNIP